MSLETPHDSARPKEPDDSALLTLTPGLADTVSAARLRAWSDEVVRHFDRALEGASSRRDACCRPRPMPAEVRAFLARANPDELCRLAAAALAALVDRA